MKAPRFTLAIIVILVALLIGGLFLRTIHRRLEAVEINQNTIAGAATNIEKVVTNIDSIASYLTTLAEKSELEGNERTKAIEDLQNAVARVGTLTNRLQKSVTIVERQVRTTNQLVVRNVGGKTVVETIRPSEPNPPGTVTRCLVDIATFNVSLIRLICPIP